MEGIDSLFVTNIEISDENLPENFLATVGAVYDDGLSLILEGQAEATTKHYRCNTSVKFAAGDRVKVARISGSYVVEYVVGPPGSGGGGGTSGYQDRIIKNGYGVKMSGSRFFVGIHGDEYIGAVNNWFDGGCFGKVYVVNNANTYATLACNSSGKLLVNGTVIG